MEILQYLIEFFSTYGYLAVFGVLMLCGFGLPVPEDITLVAGGVISGLGYTDVHTMFAVSMAGVLLGDGTLFCLGRFFGERVRRVGFISKLLTPVRYAAVQAHFERYGNWVLFVARFTPGLRAPVFLVAGLSNKISFLRFLLTDGFAALISVPIWVYLGYYGAHEKDRLMEWIHQGQTGILATLGIAALALFFWIRKQRKKKLFEVPQPTSVASVAKSDSLDEQLDQAANKVGKNG